MVGIEGTTGSLTALTHRASVTESNELVVTGSITKSNNLSDLLVSRDTEAILFEILREIKKTNIYLADMTGNYLNNEDVE